MSEAVKEKKPKVSQMADNLIGSEIIKLANEIKQILFRTGIKEKILSIGADPNGLELDKFAALIKEEIDMYRQIVTLGGIKAE
jgi:tripartite-type tricarboxylate transporter receptor subunit TctC